MNIGKVSVNNIRHRPLSAALSILLMAFGVGIIIMLMGTTEQLEKQFTKNIRGIDMVVGAKGSPLQLILSSVYHIDPPTGNIALSEFNKLSKNPLVEKTIPLAYGDNYDGYRIVGSSPEYPRHYEASLATGDWWKNTGEVTVGSRVAELANLEIGHRFNSSHGLSNAMDEHDHFSYTVVGILKPTGTVIDKLILTDISSVWAVHASHDDTQTPTHGEVTYRDSNNAVTGAHIDAPGEAHEHDGDLLPEGEHHEEEREITAGLIKFRSPMGNLTVPRMVNQNTNMQAALPAIEVNRLFSLMGNGVKMLRILAVLIVLISAISVFISLYQTLKERRFELALMRSMGASSWQLLLIVLLEGMVIALIGYFVGLVLGKAALLAISNLAQETYQYSFDIQWINADEALLLPLALGIGFIAAIIPALQAYRLNISKVLADA